MGTKAILSRRRRRRPGPGELFDAFELQDFSQNTCFLCGAKLTAANRSDEHVFPKWLLRRFALYNKKLVLLNGTEIEYRHLKIPCCLVCNNRHLSKIEQRVRDVVEGDKPIATLDKETLYLWTSKIFYGLLYREVLLPLDRAKRELGPIVPVDMIRGYKLLQVFLQSARLDIAFECIHADFPASVFAFQLQEPKTEIAKFDFHDDIEHFTIYLRLGRVGIIAAFDAGAQAFEWRWLYKKYSRARLHPLQFEELGAAMFAKARLFDRTPKLMISGNRRIGYHVMILPLRGMSTKPVFREWNSRAFAECLSIFTGIPIDHLSPDGNGVMTFMTWPNNGRYKAIDIRKFPYRGVP